MDLTDLLPKVKRPLYGYSAEDDFIYYDEELRLYKIYMKQKQLLEDEDTSKYGVRLITLQNKVKELNDAIKELREEYYTALDDNSISIETRWKLLTAFPDFGRTVNLRTVKNFSVELLSEYGEWEEYACDLDRHSTTEVFTILERLIKFAKRTPEELEDVFSDDCGFPFGEEEELKFKTFCVNNKVTKYWYDVE